MHTGWREGGKVLKIVTYTVKPVYNRHPWDPKKVAVAQGAAVVQILVQNTR